MAINTATQAEIKRKAEAGIALTNPTAESTALYNQYKKAAEAAKTSSQTNTAGQTGTPATVTTNKTGISGSGATGSGSAGASGAVSAIQREYGSNINNFDTNNAAQKSLADLGQKWAAATSKEERDRISAEALKVGTAAGGVRDEKTGLWSFAQQPQTMVSGPQPGYVPSYTGPDLTGMKSEIETMFGNRQASELAKLREALAVALQGYNSQETQAKQLAYDNRNSADVASMQGEQALKEMMANMGMIGNGGGDGQNLTLQTAQNASRLGAVNNINRDEANALMDILQKKNLLQNNAQGQELALIQAIGSDKAQALYDLLKYGDSRAWDMEQYNYGRYRDNVNDQFRQDATDWQRKLDEAGMTGNWGGSRSMQGQQFDTQQEGARLANELSKLQLDAYPEEQRLRIEQLKKTIDQIGAKPAQTQYEKDMQQIDLEKARIELDRLKNPQAKSNLQTAEQMRTYFDSMVERDKNGRITNGKALEASILNAPISDYDAYQLYVRYGLVWDGPIPQPGN